MSASLVGSEMCIRDRALRLSKVGLSRHTGQEPLFWNLASADASASDAVSYTHLTLPTICSV
eukprot:11637398-Alexandrium_andersonii.AAC.1